MSVKNRKTRIAACGPRQPLSFAVSEPAVAGDSFQATLSGCAQAEAYRGSMPESNLAPRQMKWLRWQAICSDSLRRAWSSLHAKYKISTTKRLHVSETISLGEKRFVAIVAVEGREFLIGGGVSGISLLAQLGSRDGAARDFGKTIGDGGGAL
jgi:hypothetical protein